MAWGESFLSGLADNSSLLKALGLMTAGTGAAAYALSPDDAEAGRSPWQENLLAALKDGAPKNVDFGPVESKLFQQLKSLDERYTPGDLTIPGNIVQKFIDKRIGPDGSGAESFVDDLNSLFHSSKSKALGSDFPGRQQVVNAGERMSMLGAAEPQMEGGGAVITGYPIPTKRLQRKVNSAPGGRVVSTIPSPLDGAGDQPTRLSDVGADSGQNISSDDSVVKTVVPLVWGSGLLGAGGYGLSSPGDANASVSSVIANDLTGDAERALARDAERGAAASSRDWAKDAGNNTPNIAQALTPNDPFSPSSSQLAATAALITALKSKDQPLEDTYQPGDLFAAFMTGGAGLAPKLASAALDPVISAGMDYVPGILDAINPRNIVVGLMR